MDRTYDPVLAERSVRELAAVTDAELAADIRAALTVVVDQAQVWQRGPDRAQPTTRSRCAIITAADEAIAALPDDIPLPEVIAAVRPILGAWWPENSDQAVAVSHAVEQLRAAAMHRTALVRDARYITGHGRT